MTARIAAVDTYDIRFPTSRGLDGSDAMNPDPDYSAAYVVLRTDAADGPDGHGFAFTIGRGNEVQVAALEALRPHVLGRDVDELCGDPGSLARDLVGDSQLRWLGPEKGVMHMAIGAVLNAVWDLAAKREGKPLWQLLADAEPQWLVSQVDFRYLTDALTPERALELLRRGREGRAEREEELRAHGYPAYTTSPGWPLRTTSPRSSSRSARTSRTTSAAAGPPGPRSARTSGWRSTPTSAGTLPRRSNGPTHWPSSPRTGSRSRPARTTCSGMRPSGAASPRSGWPPASTSRTASWSSSCCRPGRWTCSSWTRPGSAASTRTWRSCCSPPSTGCRSARTPAGWACANSSSTSPCSTISRCPAVRTAGSSSTSTTCTSTSSPRPSSAAAATSHRPHRASRQRCTPSPSPPTPSPTVPSGPPTAPPRTTAPPAAPRPHRPRRHHRTGGDHPMTPLAGLTAVVTGGASGIGLATARLLAAQGTAVAVLDLDPAGAPPPLLGLTADVADDASVRAAVAQAAEVLGGIDILVNNAGIGATGTVEDNDDAQWHRVLDVNVLGIVRTTRAALPHLRRSKRAAVVNTCSIAATAGLPQRALYSASKGAVLALTLALAADHVREGIRVNCVNPGTVDTPWVGRLLDAADDPAAERAALNARQPTGRLVDADEVAAAVAYLAGPAAGSVTGTALAVDGGMAGLRLRPAAP